MKTTDFSKMLFEIEALAGTGSRNEITRLLLDLFLHISIEESKVIIYFLQARIAPRYNPIEFQLSTKQLLKVLSEFCTVPLEEINSLYKEIGDIGKLAWRLNDKQCSGLEILTLHQKLMDIAKVSGKDSLKTKLYMLLELFHELDSRSAGYVARIIEGNLRLNISDKTILDTFSFMITGDKSSRELVEHAFGVRSDLGEILEVIKSIDFSAEKLAEMKVELFTPIASKLVEREITLDSLHDRIPTGFVQPKFDGLRCQSHIANLNGKVKIQLFSRNMEDITDMFPDIVSQLELFASSNRYKSYIFDSEIIGFDKDLDRFLPFQETIQRKRKHGIKDKTESIPVEMHIFDVMMLNTDLTNVDLTERIKLLESLHLDSKLKIKITETKLIHNKSDIKDLFDKYVGERLEGLILKRTDSKYDPGTRNFDWIKFKRSSESKLNDTVDGVIIGYYLAKGQKTEFGLGSLLIAVYDKFREKFLTITKVSSLTQDEMLSYKPILDKLILKDKPIEVECNKMYLPDFWIEPKIVVEIEADEITKSENHTSEFSLRFPRIKYWGRDKDPTASTSLEEIEKMFNSRNK